MQKAKNASEVFAVRVPADMATEFYKIMKALDYSKNDLMKEMMKNFFELCDAGPGL